MLPTFVSKLRPLALAPLLLLGSPLALATDDAGVAGVTVGVGGGIYDFDSVRGLDEADFGQLSFGYTFDNRFGLEAVVGSFEGETETTKADVDALQYRLDALYHFAAMSGWTPYVATGFGGLKVDVEGAADDDTYTQFNMGGGVKKMLGESFQIRGDLRAFHNMDEKDTEGAAALSLGYLSAFAGEPAQAPMPVDSDGDGVYDDKDECPNTVANAVVDEKGCQIVKLEEVSVRLDVQFDTDKSIIKPGFDADINTLADFMQTYPQVKVVVEGHTDDRGSKKYNQALSERRAASVRQRLIDLGVAAERVTAIGYGEERPIADNKTAEGRYENRRVEALVSAQVQKKLTK